MASLFLINSPRETSAPTRVKMVQPAPQADHFQTERALALMLIAAAAVFLRAWDPWYSTAYMDESIYVVYGRMFLTHHFESPLSTPLQWSFGWYLWPAMAAVADKIGGLFALREMAATLGVITVAATYGFATRVFSNIVGLGAAAVMAVLAPAVLVSRIATRDSGCICFFALGLWAFACAWQTDRKRHWTYAALCFFAAFLCKYLVAIFFPLLVLLALWKGRKAIFIFCLPLFAACAIYAGINAHDLLYLLKYGSSYSSLRAPAAEARQIYFWNRWDFWIIAVCALSTLLFRELRRRGAILLLGACAFFAFQLKTRADYDYWKHVNYALLFLVPLAVAAIIYAVRRLYGNNYFRRMLWGVGGVVALAIAVAALGKTENTDRFVFWPDVEPVLAFFEGRLTPNDRLLVDDTVFRYYFQSTLHQYQITDPMFFRYGQNLGDDAYKNAVSAGAFTYIVLDEGIGEEARRLDVDIRPLLGGYDLQMEAFEPTLGHKVEIYARKDQVAPETMPGIRIVSPVSKSVVVPQKEQIVVQGIAKGAQPGWSAQVEVFTDRWYVAGPNVAIYPDGRFNQAISLSGQGRQQCSHLIRARLFDEKGNQRAVILNYGIARANPDGSAPLCR
ncbi:MAG: hypothetical protein DMG65_15035 [Candidatus Angelobacter sp. Gp1-AA117]|nr:MAG: hypothetical protein DMG65_15035 [Candidatus Angelobacter sp. Gp1-AA117]